MYAVKLDFVSAVLKTFMIYTRTTLEIDIRQGA